VVLPGDRIREGIGAGNNNDITGMKYVEYKSHKIPNPCDQRIQDDKLNLTFLRKFVQSGYFRQ